MIGPRWNGNAQKNKRVLEQVFGGYLSRRPEFFPWPHPETDTLVDDLANGYMMSNSVFRTLQEDPLLVIPPGEAPDCRVKAQAYGDRFFMYKELFE